MVTKFLVPALLVTALLVASCSTSTSAPDETATPEPSGQQISDCVKDGQGFTGGATVPLQIFGSYGPGQSLVWDVAKGKTAGGAQNVQMATGMPNGIVTILWGKDAGAGENTLTVECTTGWGVYDEDDPTKLWHGGIISNGIPGLGTDTIFCHRIEMDTSGDQVTMKMWETFWKYGEDYTCPDTLQQILDGDLDFPNPVTYLELPDTGIGAGTVPPSEWTTDGTEVGVVL